MAYVITGATGHIGNNLARSLIQNHKEVVILTRRMDRAIEGLHAKFIVGDIFDDSFLDNHIRENDIVIHLAGVIDIKNNKMDETYKINYELTKKMVDICMNKNIERFIYFSSVGSQNHCFLGPFRIKNLHIIMLIFKQISAY